MSGTAVMLHVPLEEQVNDLGTFIINLDVGLPNRNVGAVDTAKQFIGELGYAYDLACGMIARITELDQKTIEDRFLAAGREGFRKDFNL